MLVLLTGCNGGRETDGPYFGNGLHNEWADQHSIVIWTRLTQHPEMNLYGQPFIPLTTERH